VTPAARNALARALLAIADDELVLGYRDTEWTGAAPVLEEDVAFSSIGQDEVGHARLFYALLHDLTGAPADYRARRPDEYCHACFVETRTAPRYSPEGDHRGGSDWAYAIVRQYLYDLFDAERLSALRDSSWDALAEAVDKVQREEKYHLQHGRMWLDRLAGGGPAGRERLEAELERAWPHALALFEPLDGEEVLVAERLSPVGARELRDRWLERLWPVFSAHHLALPGARGGPGGWNVTVAAAEGGRNGRHTPDWEDLWNEMTSVYRLDPAAVW